MTRARRVDEATVRTQQGDEVTLAAMDDGSLAVIAPSGPTAWSVVSLLSGPTGTRLRMMPRGAAPGDDNDAGGTDLDSSDDLDGSEG